MKQIKNSLNAGELSEYMAGRTDINKYHNGCSKLINATVLPHGGVVKRSGTKFIGESPNSCRLIPFEFSVDDALVLEFSNNLIRFYKSGDRVYEDDIEIASTTEDDPVLVTTDAAHGLADDEWVYLEDIDTATSLNGKMYQITVTGAGGVTKFTLQDTQGADIDGTGIGVGGAAGSCKRVYQIASPYTSAQAFQVHTTQSADVMYLAHKDVHPKKLSRAGATDWTIADVGFEGGPFLDENITATTATYTSTSIHTRAGTDYYFPVGDVGTLAVTGGFQNSANDVETQWLIKHTRADNKVSLTANGTSAAVPVLGDFHVSGSGFTSGSTTLLVQRKQGNGEWQDYRKFTAAFSYSGTEDEDDTSYRITLANAGTTTCTFTAKAQVNYGIVEVTAKIDADSATVIVIKAVGGEAASGTATSATKMWAEGAWGKYRGYPRTVTFFEDRLWWASTANNPDTLWSSKSSDYENMGFTELGADDEAITFPINDNEVSQIQWMMPRQVMAVGTANKEYRFGASDPDKPTTPSDRKVRLQTSLGSHTIQPQLLNNAIFYFQRPGRKLRAMSFDSISESFDSIDATLMNNTMFDSTPKTMAVQRVPDSIIWVTRTDGVLASYTYEPAEEVAGWARHFTANSTSVESAIGLFESVTVIHGSIEDEVWVSVKRTINGNTVYYVEQMATRFFDQIDEALMLDSAVTVASSNAAKDIVLASDTVRCGFGECNSGLCGGVTA